MPRGFTLLETVMAAELGGLIVAVCMSVFGLVDRTDSAMNSRAQQVSDLSLVHQAMQRSLLSLVMSPRAPAGLADQNEDDPPRDTGDQRFILEFATDEIDPRLLGEPKTVPPEDRVNTQRLELRLSRPPMPGMSTRRRGQETPESVGGVHGAFELRPTQPDELAGSAHTRRGKPLGMSLWWTPIDTSTTRETLLASGLNVCQWKVFRDRERVDEFGVTYWHNLPAFVEMEIETINRVYATWLFEIDATVARPSALQPTNRPEEPEIEEPIQVEPGDDNTMPEGLDSPDMGGLR